MAPSFQTILAFSFYFDVSLSFYFHPFSCLILLNCLLHVVSTLLYFPFLLSLSIVHSIISVRRSLKKQAKYIRKKTTFSTFHFAFLLMFRPFAALHQPISGVSLMFVCVLNFSTSQGAHSLLFPHSTL
jgi:hypothetical protein